MEASLRAEHAIDGDRATRWGSAFNDAEWFQVDFGEVREISGLRIFWEAAYGRDYDILVSTDSATWKTVYSIRYGDGNLDELFFGRQSARYLRIQGHRRGTGWGYSIWEIEFAGPEELPTLRASGEMAGHPASHALDGDTQTYWMSQAGSPQHLTIELKGAKDLGGVEILWGGDHASRYRLAVSNDGESWKTVDEVTDGVGGSSLSYFDRVSTRWLRLTILSGPSKRFSVSEILLKSGDESWSPMRFYEALQSRMPKGALPRWISREQSFWTVTGVPEDAEESLIGEEGTIEPYFGSFTVTPFIVESGKVRTHRDFDVTQELEERALPLPIVRWSGGGIELEIRAASSGAAGSSVTVAKYQVTNRSEKKRACSLALAVRPLQLNPPWQYGGFSRIDTAYFIGSGRELEINNRRVLVALSDPTRAWLVSRKDGDVFSTLALPNPPRTETVTDDKGLISGALRFEFPLKPGESRSVTVVYPLHSGLPVPDGSAAAAGRFFEETRDRQKTAWTERLRGWTIEIPDTRLTDIARSYLAYMLINADYAAPQPGPRNYAKAWARDGALSAGTYLRLGQTQAVRQYLDWFTPQVGPDGFVPPMLESRTNRIPDWARDWKEHDAQGEYVYAVREFYEFTKDREYLKSAFLTVMRVLAYQQALIDQRKTEKYRAAPFTEYYGILPESNSHEGYFPAMHSYWDDFFAIRGLKDGIAIAEILEDTAAAEKFRAEEKEFRKDLYASLRAVIARDRLEYVPGCAEKGDFDPTSTSIALNACGEKTAILADSVVGRALFSGYDKYLKDVRPRWTGGPWQSFTPYEVRTVEALARLGRRKDALELMAFFTGEPVRPRGWNHMAEVVHTDLRTGSYIGDMPHTWVGSDYINALRSFFVFEEAGELIVAAAVSAEWIEGGVRVDLPTWHGRIRYRLYRDTGGDIVLDAAGDASPPGGFLFRHPFADHISSATIDGAAVELQEAGEIRFPSLPVLVRIHLTN